MLINVFVILFWGTEAVESTSLPEAVVFVFVSTAVAVFVMVLDGDALTVALTVMVVLEPTVRDRPDQVSAFPTWVVGAGVVPRLTKVRSDGSVSLTLIEVKSIVPLFVTTIW